MLRKCNEVRVAETKNAKGGNNSVFFNFLLETDEFNKAGRVFQKVVVPPMSSIGYHVHEGDSEAYYILEGTGTYNNNGEITEVKPGDLTFTPDGCGHGMENRTDKDLVFIACILYNFDKKDDLESLRKIRRPGDFETYTLDGPFGGKGQYPGMRLLLGDEFTGGGRVYNVISMLQGCSLGEHEHTGESEVFYILSGKGLFLDDGVEKEVCEGDVLLTGPGHKHALKNPYAEDLKYLALIFYDKR